MSALEPIDVDAIIVAHNSGELLALAVESLRADLPAERIHVMDAESNDGSIERLQAADTGIDIRAVPNRGFAASNNEGIRATAGEFVLLLNPDAELESGSLRRLLDVIDSDSRVGVLGGLLLNDDGSVQDGAWGRSPSLGVALSLAVRRMLASMRGRRFAPEVPETRFDVDWLTGALMLVRREAIDQAGLMDEHFFLYYEDVDWCDSIRAAGWRVVVDPSARAVHRSGSSGGGMSHAGQRAYRESFWYYCDKHGLWGLKLAARVGVGVRGWLRR